MASTYCPHCRTLALTRLIVEPGRRFPQGQEPALRVFHCAGYNGFIRSEAVPQQHKGRLV
ncbi:MAG: hypothetical protein GKR89_23830 [Candidatus Latescibacteria bacterium]|nr:hypothetical protein [Candidatus Latescibacterota bacterium]